MSSFNEEDLFYIYATNLIMRVENIRKEYMSTEKDKFYFNAINTLIMGVVRDCSNTLCSTMNYMYYVSSYDDFFSKVIKCDISSKDDYTKKFGISILISNNLNDIDFVFDLGVHNTNSVPDFVSKCLNEILSNPFECDFKYYIYLSRMKEYIIRKCVDYGPFINEKCITGNLVTLPLNNSYVMDKLSKYPTLDKDIEDICGVICNEFNNCICDVNYIIGIIGSTFNTH